MKVNPFFYMFQRLKELAVPATVHVYMGPEAEAKLKAWKDRMKAGAARRRRGGWLRKRVLRNQPRGPK